MYLPRRILALAWMPLAALVLACAGPTATSVPNPTPTATTPPATATATPNPVSPAPSDGLTDNALANLRRLVEELGPRQSATSEEEAAAQFLAGRFNELGYATEIQPFTVEALSPERSGLFVGDNGNKIEALPLAGSAFTEVSGPLVPVGLARQQDIPSAGLEGKIALAERGSIRFGQKVRNAVEAGAVGVVIYNNQPGNFRGNLGRNSAAPAVSISQEDGQRLAAMASDGPVEATIALELEDLPSRNVIAEKPGTGEGVVILGGHYDTVPDIAGANDNASGTAVLLTLAEELSDRDFPFTLRFIAFGSEEIGLLGSRFYVDSLSREERQELLAMLNFDALAGGDRIEVLGSRELTSAVAELAEQQNIPVRVSGGTAGSTSDHASFVGVGVPVITFASEDFSRIHTPEDTLEHVTPRLLGDASRLGMLLLDHLAQPQATQ